MVEARQRLPAYRARIGIYPLWGVGRSVVLAQLGAAPRGPKDLAKFAKGLSQAQRRALGVRRPKDRPSPAPSHPPSAA